MSFRSLLTSISPPTFSTIKPPLKPGLTYVVRLTQVRALTPSELVVMCSARDPESDVGVPVLWRLHFGETTSADLKVLDTIQDLRWVIGDDGQIAGIVDPWPEEEAESEKQKAQTE